MIYPPVLVTPPEETPISLDEAKANCRVDLDNHDEDGLIAGLIEAATSMLDGYSGILGRCLVTQTWQVSADDFCQQMRLPLGASGISSVKARNAAGQLSTIATPNYDLRADALGSYVRFKDSYSYPSDLAETQGVVIEFEAGYGLAEDVPAAIKQAMHLLVAHWYANREATTDGAFEELPLGAKALLSPFRRVGV